MATPKTRRKTKKKEKVDAHGKAHIKSTFNNTIITLADNYGNTIVRPGYHGGQPFGVLCQDVVDIDLTRDYCGTYEVPSGGLVDVIQSGTVCMCSFDDEIKSGQQVFYDKDGHLTTNKNDRPIGFAVSNSDPDGFTQVAIKI